MISQNVQMMSQLALMLFGKRAAGNRTENDDAAITKLFFDSFSKRVSMVEDGLKKLAKETENLHLSIDRSQISDLVLLERLQKAEAMLEESLVWIKKVSDSVASGMPGKKMVANEPGEEHVPAAKPSALPTPAPFQGIEVSQGQTASLPSITTPTELQVLALLSDQGPKSAPEIGRLVGRSREHSARLMKKLFEEGYVNRDQSRIPFRYSPVERVRATFKKPEKKDEAREEAAVAPA